MYLNKYIYIYAIVRESSNTKMAMFNHHPTGPNQIQIGKKIHRYLGMGRLLPMKLRYDARAMFFYIHIR